MADQLRRLISRRRMEPPCVSKVGDCFAARTIGTLCGNWPPHHAPSGHLNCHWASADTYLMMNIRLLSDSFALLHRRYSLLAGLRLQWLLLMRSKSVRDAKLISSF